jgi:hypothetical protein
LVIESAEISVHRVWAARLWSRIGLIGFYVGPLSVFLGLALNRPPSWLFPFAYLPWIVPWTVSYVLWFLRGAAPGSVQIEAGHSEIQRGRSKRRIARSEITSAYALEDKVEIVLRSGDVITFRANDVEAIVSELGFGPGRRRQAIDLASRRRRLLHLPLAFAAYQLASVVALPLMMVEIALVARQNVHASNSLTWAFPLIFAVVGVVLPLIYRALKRRTRAPSIEVGDDGVTITTTKGSTHHARDMILAARPLARGLALDTTLGSVPVTGTMLDDAKCNGAVKAILDRWSSMPALPPRAQAFAQQGRTIAAWSSELRARIADGGYRDASGITLDDAEAVLESAASPADARLGAALALAAGGRRARIAELAAPIANPRLRVALEAVAEGRDEPELLARAMAARDLC